ncbi:hypothetical protein [Legionella sp. CNM-4043-24]|uniref:hypothetical protein n=1 Tax=Legionella sp. CNM-4043-24 TaxID=3421646 RepID=UPI00403AEBC6
MKEKLELKRVSPTNTLFFLPGAPMDCERQAAKIRNHTVSSMEKNDVRSVAYRYLQNRAGETCTRREATVYGVLFISFIYYFIFHLPNEWASHPQLKHQMQEDELYRLIQVMGALPSFFTIPLFLSVLPNVRNTLRYRETKNSCQVWLTQKIGNDDFQQIEHLSYNQEGFFKINELMDKKRIPAALIENIPTRYSGLKLRSLCDEITNTIGAPS